MTVSWRLVTTRLLLVKEQAKRAMERGFRLFGEVDFT